MSFNSSLNPVNRRLSGEKQSQWALLEGEVKVLIFLRVIASKISIAVERIRENAMNLPHGDHPTAVIELGGRKVAIVVSHEVGRPCTTLTKGRQYCS